VPQGSLFSPKILLLKDGSLLRPPFFPPPLIIFKGLILRRVHGQFPPPEVKPLLGANQATATNAAMLLISQRGQPVPRSIPYLRITRSRRAVVKSTETSPQVRLDQDHPQSLKETSRITPPISGLDFVLCHTTEPSASPARSPATSQYLFLS